MRLLRSLVSPCYPGPGPHRKRVVAAVLLAMACLSFTVPAGAMAADDDEAAAEQPTPEELAEQGLVQLDAPETGTLLFETNVPGWYVPAPMLLTDIDVSVSGPIARTVVSQRFRNAADTFVNGKYVFPLPEGAAVDTLRMRVGDRWIEGQIEERAAAREIFEEARAEGRVASLIEQQRPNVFTTSVANIPPTVDVVVQIEYQQSLAPKDGVFGLRVPLVKAPRYTPGRQPTPQLVLTNVGWAVDPESQAAQVASLVADPNTTDPDASPNLITVSVDLNAGFPLGPIDSVYHEVNVAPLGSGAAFIELDGVVPADRDFYLSWKPAILTETFAATFSEESDTETHYIAMFTPQSAESIGDESHPREVIFVQDTSGSMEGASLAQAKAGLTIALERLEEHDTFNIIEFNTEYTRFSRTPVAATKANVLRASKWVDNLESIGGTEMVPALRQALTDNDVTDGRLRQVIFLTDGAVSNERELLELIEARLGKSRLFTVGIGSAPNSYFMTSTARAGRGASVTIGDLTEVREQMQNLFTKIETPAVIDLAVEGLIEGAEVSPSPLPDLYAGDPLVLTIRMPNDAAPSSLTVTGRKGTQDWQRDILLDDADPRSGVSKLWAREHIRDLEALRTAPDFDYETLDELEATILQTALSAGLVSRLTSLVAVDIEVSNPNAVATDTEVPTNLPDGWDPDQFVVAAGPRGDAAVPADLDAALIDRLAAAEAERAAERGDAPRQQLAYTGAVVWTHVTIGVLMLALGAIFITISNRRQSATIERA